MKSITKIERDDYLVLPNPDLVNEYKVINFDYVVGSGERTLFFGELQVNSILRVEGELNVLHGNLYVGISPSGLSYSNIIVNQNGSVNSIPTLSQGTTPITYTVSPSLPTGLSLNSITGVISGNPSNVQSLTSYIITATNGAGSTTATISITVNAILPSGLSYSNIVVNINTSTSSTPTLSQGTTPITYTVSPSLPSGLSIDSSTGVISGTPTNTQSLTSYTVTATNSVGSTNATINITVNIIAPSGLSYNSGQTAIPLISTSVSYSPTLSAGTSPTYSVSPPLPSGLSLNTSNGIISGTTPSSSNDTTYTITATNSGGSTTASFKIRIVYVNTTMTVGFYDDIVDNWGYVSNSLGSISNTSFRGTTISTLVFDANNYIYFEILGFLPNTDSGAFKNFIWNNVTYTRSGNLNDYYTNTSGGVTLTKFNSLNTVTQPFNKVNPPNPSTVSLIIE